MTKTTRRVVLFASAAAALSAVSVASVSRAADAPAGGAGGGANSTAAAEWFSLADTAGDHLDVLLDDKIVARYMYAHDPSSKERLHDTYKPYLHVFDADGAAPITKGPGGQFTHHRGIFAGWNKIAFGGKTYDRWHMKDGEIVHRKFTEQTADADSATITSATDWNDEHGKPLLTEQRTMTFRPAAPPARLMIGFTTRLTAPAGDVTLAGDPEHAGVQFRPANEVNPRATTYLYPVESAAPHKDLDYPWVGQTFELNGRRYSVVHLNHPTNPKGTRYSAYRDYGRFGAFPVATIKAGESLELKYGFLVADGEMPPVEQIQKAWDAFAGVERPTPAPKTTTLPAEGKKAPAPKQKKK